MKLEGLLREYKGKGSDRARPEQGSWDLIADWARKANFKYLLNYTMLKFIYKHLERFPNI